MKSSDPLERLLRAAALASGPEKGEAPSMMAGRVVFDWRAARAIADLAGMHRLFRFGLGFAAGLMVVIVSLSLREIEREPLPEMALPAMAVNLALSD